MNLVDYCRDHGVAMGSVFVGKHIGFTTDIDKVNVCREAGANVSDCYNATGPRGWEIHFAVRREVDEAVEADKQTVA